MSCMFCKQNGIDNKPQMCVHAYVCVGGEGHFYNLMQVKKINLHFTLLKTKVSLQGFVYNINCAQCHWICNVLHFVHDIRCLYLNKNLKIFFIIQQWISPELYKHNLTHRMWVNLHDIVKMQ